MNFILYTFIVDCTEKELDPTTDRMLKMIGGFVEMERNMISERVENGVANAMAKGKVVGRPTLKLSDIPKKVIDIY